jgi:hypothetical protein
VHVVEAVRGERPGLRGVFHLEEEVGRDPAWLDGRDVGADYGGVGVRVGEVAVKREGGFG